MLKKLFLLLIYYFLKKYTRTYCNH